MLTRLMRILIVVIGVAIGFAAASLLKDLDTQIQTQRVSTDSLRDRARALAATIADVRAGQFAYVAQGQGEAFWMMHVAGLMPALQKQMADFRASLTAAAAREALEPATAALDNFQTLDTRVKEYVSGGNPLLAADLIFSDGLESTATASTQIAAALNEELQARESGTGAMRRRQATIASFAGGAVFLLMVLLAVTSAASTAPGEAQTVSPAIEPVRFEAPLPRAKPAITPKLISTARLCSDLARVSEGKQLGHLLERTARVLDASGIIVWVADAAGRELRPAMAHGYADHVVGKMGGIPREANNAAAAAYRSAEMRTVPGDNLTTGAIVAPLMTAEGCVGVLSAEMKGGSEKDESSQALATIFAAQLATLVSPPSTAAPAKAAAQA